MKYEALICILKSNAETDMDIDASDDMNYGCVHHLPRGLLNSACDSSFLDKGNKQKSVQSTQHLNKKSRKPAAINWKNSTDVHPTFKLLEASAVPEEEKEIIKSAIDAFKVMFSDNLAFHVTNQTNIYAVQHGKGYLKILEDEIRTFVALYSCQGIAKFHIKIFFGQMHLKHKVKQSHVQ